jgi:hypothetical protein
MQMNTMTGKVHQQKRRHKGAMNSAHLLVPLSFTLENTSLQLQQQQPKPSVQECEVVQVAPSTAQRQSGQSNAACDHAVVDTNEQGNGNSCWRSRPG